jgi:hypothetical protein
LIRGGDTAQTLVGELLDALALVRLGAIEVALRVRGDAVDAIELPRLAAAVAEAEKLFQRVAAKHVNLHVPAVRDVEVRLLRIL